MRKGRYSKNPGFLGIRRPVSPTSDVNLRRAVLGDTGVGHFNAVGGFRYLMKESTRYLRSTSTAEGFLMKHGRVPNCHSPWAMYAVNLKVVILTTTVYVLLMAELPTPPQHRVSNNQMCRCSLQGVSNSIGRERRSTVDLMSIRPQVLVIRCREWSIGTGKREF